MRRVKRDVDLLRVFTQNITMRLKDYNVFFKSLGKQLNFVLILGVWACVLFAVVISLPLEKFTKNAMTAITAFLVAYFLGYSLLLTKKLVEKYYK